MTFPARDVQLLDPGAIWEGYILDTTALGGSVYYLTAMGAATWQGNAYANFPIMAEGFERNTSGKLPRPKITVANLDGAVGALVRDAQDLVGSKVTRKRTFAKYLDGQPAADPTAGFQDESFWIERKSLETAEAIEFELVTALDLDGLKLPRRIIQATVCPWVFKGAECGYAGADSTCTKTLAACQAKFGTSPARFGGFPGARLR